MASPSSVVKEAVKESLVGSDTTGEGPALHMSAQSKARFNKHAVRDAETGELYMGPDEFINAIAPVEEDYVSCDPRWRRIVMIEFYLLKCIIPSVYTIS